MAERPAREATRRQASAERSAAGGRHADVARRLDELVRDAPSPEALLDAVQALLQAGELDPADLPAVEHLLAGALGPTRPARSGTTPAHLKTLPREQQAHLSDRMIADADHVTAAASGGDLDADALRDALTTLERWATIDEQQGLGGSLLDEFLRRVPVDALKRSAPPEARGRLTAVLRRGQALGHLAGDAPAERPSAWNDVVVKTTLGLPGSAAAFAGGAVRSLPLPGVDEAGAWLQEQGRASLQEAGWAADEARDVVDTGGALGAAWGTGMQALVGMGALGGAAKAGAGAAQVAERVRDLVGLAEDVDKLLTVTGPLLVAAFKVFTDLLKKAAAGKEITNDDIAAALASRAVKEVLGSLGAGAEDGTRVAAGKAYAERKSHSRAGDKAQLNASTFAERASAAHAHADSRRGEPDARTSRLNAVEQERMADTAHEKANAERSSARASVARYLVYTVLHRLLVNLAAVLTEEVAKSAVADRDMGTSQSALYERVRSRMRGALASTLREVVADVLTRLILQEAGAFAAAPKVVQDSVKLGIDGVTKIVAGCVERVWSEANDG